MLKRLLPFISGLFLLFSSMPLHAKETIIKTDSINLWCETFGSPRNPPLLLIMGGGCQGIMWPTAFCKKVARQGFFVIRFDHRDMGLSSSFDYKTNGYTLLDMAQDCTVILDHFHISKAHIVGTSMGGLVAQLLGAHYPHRVQTLTLISTTKDFSVLMDTFEGKVPLSNLPPPTKSYLKWIQQHAMHKNRTDKDKFQALIDGWRILSGSTLRFDQKMQERIAKEVLKRNQNPGGLNNHIMAIKASLQMSKDAPQKITAPTLIIHGTEDPIFPLEHAKALKEDIPHAHFKVIEGLGHNLTKASWHAIINEMSNFAKAKENDR